MDLLLRFYQNKNTTTQKGFKKSSIYNFRLII